jgi:glycosyltransferase involved in cell wall biosynthesis
VPQDEVAGELPEPDLSIVIPAYKEGTKIERDVRAAFSFLREQGLTGEIIVVDDGSPDDTFAKTSALKDEIPILRVLRYAKNRGKGHALRYGITRTRGKRVLFADAGLCVPYEIASIGLTMMELGMCDIAHGSRAMRGSVRRAQPLYRRIGSRCYSILIHTVMGIPWYLSDTNCGFKIYRRDVALDLFGRSFTDGFMYDIEIVLRALAARLTILEFPVLWSNDPDTRFDPRTGSLRLLRELLMIRFRLALEGRAAASGLADSAAPEKAYRPLENIK